MLRKTLFLILLLSFVVSCAERATKRPLALDFSSPAKEALLRERVEEFWRHMVKGELDKAYDFYDPFFRARMGREEFVSKHQTIKYKDFELLETKIEGNVARVKVKVTYYIPKIKVIKRVFSVPETTKEFEETWLFIGDNWYKEYVFALVGRGVVYY